MPRLRRRLAQGHGGDLDGFAGDRRALVGTRVVSPSTTTTRAKDTSSSSATICPSAVRMPVPRSTWPLKAVTEPSAVMLMKVSKCLAAVPRANDRQRSFGRAARPSIRASDACPRPASRRA
jgi:hypothetical protein